MTDAIVAILRPNPEWRTLMRVGRSLSPNRPARWKVGPWTLLTLVMGFVPLIVLIVRGDGPGPRTMLALAAVVFVFQHAASSAMEETDRAAFGHAVRAIADGLGPVRLTLDPQGLAFEGRDASLTLGWRHVERIVHDTDALILATGAFPIPIPRASLPEGTRLGETKAILEAWRIAAGRGR
ncbi:MAG: hypothetical protein AAFU61_14960 [Pseudomonadota bacterium]